MSPANEPRPVTSGGSSSRGTEAPMTDAGSVVTPVLALSRAPFRTPANYHSFWGVRREAGPKAIAMTPMPVNSP